MTIHFSTLSRAAAVALALAGVIFIVIQPLHPHEDIASITTSAWVFVHILSMTMAVLGLAGITAVYLAQASRSGILGLLGYLVFALFFIIQSAVNFAEAFILPLSAAGSPKLTEDVASLFVSGYVLQTDVGPLAVVGSLGAVLYLGGGILFAVGVLRAHVLPAWTGILLIAAALASLSAAILPHQVARYAAVPMGIALVALGVTLFMEQRRVASVAAEQQLASVAA
jgi:hypothetical protein